MRSLLLFLCILLSSCFGWEDENHHYKISFHNVSNEDVYIHQGWSYPDTIPLENGVLLYKGILKQSDIYKVKAHQSNTIALSFSDSYEKAFRFKRIKNDTLMVFVFSAKKLEDKSLLVRDAVLYRYDLSLDDLRKCNWRLIYPPQQADKDK